MIKTPYLFLLCFTAPVAMVQASPVQTIEDAAQASATPSVSVRCTYWKIAGSKGESVEVSFPEPMVGEEKVGSNVDASYYSVPVGVSCAATWTATNAFRLVLTEDCASYDIKHLTIPAGLKSLKGREMAGVSRPVFGNPYRVGIEKSFDSYNLCSGDLPPYLLIGGTSDEDVAFLDAHVDRAFFSLEESEEATVIRQEPARVRPATAADVLGVWDDFCYHMDTGDCDMDKLRREYEELAPDTPIPHLWRIEMCGEPGPEEEWRLCIPGIGFYDREGGSRQDYWIAKWQLPQLDAVLTNESLSAHDFSVELRYNQALEKESKELFRSMTWQIDTELSEENTMTWDEAKGHFSLTDAEGKEIATLAYDEKTSADKPKTGGVLAMRCHTNGERLILRLVSPLKSARGKELETEGEERSLWMKFSTNLVVRAPRVATDMTASSIRTHSSAVVHCQSEYVKDLTARVYRLEPSVSGTARLMKGYSTLYPAGYETDVKGAFFLEPGEEDPAVELERELRSPAPVPTVLLPASVTKAECVLQPDAGGECTLDPASLFPDHDPRATYFVEISGTALDGCADCKKIVNQGIVQVTDIGMMWKLSQGKVFAYVYGQGDGKPVAEGVLRLLDTDGHVVSELPVKDGVAMGDYPKETSFLQVQAGEDFYTTRSSRRADRRKRDEDYRVESLRDAGIDPDAVPRLLSHVFTDRPIYRPGEPLHIKGILRMLTGGTLSIPEAESLTARVVAGNSPKEIPVNLESDGTFHLDIPTESDWHGYCLVKFNLKYKGDDTGASPDMAVLKKGASDYSGTQDDILEENRRFTCTIPLQDFRRNEFELDSALDISADGKVAGLSVAAKSFSDIPVADAKVGWSLLVRRSPFSPAAFSEYCFGDLSEERICRRSFGSRNVGPSNRQYVSAQGVLDKEGKGNISLSVPQFEKPQRVRLTGTVSVTNGNQQTLNSVRSAVYDPSSVYAGVKCPDCLTQAGTPIELDAVLVTPEGEAYPGAPMPATLRVVRHHYQSFRYGTPKGSTVQSERESEPISTREITLGGEPLHLSVPTDRPGLYDIIIEGKDAEGKPYHTAICQYVWGAGDSPWHYYSGSGLELTPDKTAYKVGETARILVQTPVDAELQVTVESGDVKRSFHHSVTVANPILEIPMVQEDAPGVTVSVFLVQGANGRSKSALPLVKSGSVNLTVDQPEKRLTISLDTPSVTLMPREECTLSGVVKDAEGRPVPGAVVTLYAEDEGTLQVAPYSLPDPYAVFYGSRSRAAATFSMIGQMLDTTINRVDYGNKGIFVGGGGYGDDEGSFGESLPNTDYGLRENFSPCALWLGRIVADSQGRFSTTYRNPDTMTRYRVMAVASAASDLFGSAQGAYKVAQPVMLEPVAPLCAAEGDVIDVPVTIAMRPDLMPAGTPETVRWNVSLEGDNVTLPQTMQTVALSGNTPTTITFPVTAKSFGTASLTWRVQPEPTEGRFAAIKDAVKLQFPVVPPTPNLRYTLLQALEPGQELAVSSLPETEMRSDTDVDLLVSVNPLSSMGMGVNYLFSYPHGCTEQISSKLLPWLLRDELEKELDLRFPETKDSASAIAKGVKTLLSRMHWDGSFSYWGGSDSSEFSPYAALVLSFAKREVSPMARAKMRKYLLKQVEDPDCNLLALVALDRYGMGSEIEGALAEIAEKRQEWTQEDRWMFAYAAIGNSKEAEKYLQQVLSDTEAVAEEPWQLAPPVEALRLMTELRACRVLGETKCPPELMEHLRSYVASKMKETNAYSTWRMGWCCLVIHEYCSLIRESEPLSATLDAGGEQIQVAKGTPLVCAEKLGKVPLLRNTGDTPVYLSGKIEGYAAKPQPVCKVDKGFDVNRSYERLEADGSWKPTGVFKVGEVVRVSFSAKATSPADGRYLVAEDRLPACFEAVNPALPSQGLPRGIEPSNPSCWSWSTWIDHIEFRKDCVRAYVTRYGRQEAAEINLSYIARVVRSGSVTAPAAKVEYMYRPHIYGLSIPQKLEIRKGDSQ